jgi:acyl-CoA synthetase (AMP-forming)/AMP-acid ligase II
MFGQTEMTPLTSFRIDADPTTLKEPSVGGAIVELRVVDEAGRDLPQGAVGEICYRSETQMKGYYKDDAATAAATTPDGWFRSGDLGYLDEEGEVRIVDRKNECINTGGEKVYPLEVEERLGRHPAVEQCCVIGVADDAWGHAVRAVVQLQAGASASADELVDFARAELAGYKVPRSVIFVDELPLSPVGKVLRAKIRQLHGAP